LSGKLSRIKDPVELSKIKDAAELLGWSVCQKAVQKASEAVAEEAGKLPIKGSGPDAKQDDSEESEDQTRVVRDVPETC
jgi:hypothetical protein